MIKRAVIGLGYGDEGKGQTVDYLCSQNPDQTIVIRFSGGHQAGHTVYIDGKKHVFANFGSGTMRGMPTYWSKHCTVDPVGLLKEYETLEEKGISPLIYIDDRCPITTPYDMLMNELDGVNRRHGTCGVGFGKTIEREEKGYHLQYRDIFNESILAIKLHQIKEYYNGQFISRSAYVSLSNFLNACDKIRMFVLPIYNGDDRILKQYTYHVYEGSQGLLLDKDIGFFPHVTRANTDLTNIEGDVFETYLVTRTYQTRHGNGPFNRCHSELTECIKRNPDETNVTNYFQGDLRYGILDLDLYRYAIRDIKTTKVLVLTCIDHMKGDYMCYNLNELKVFPKIMDFKKYVAGALGATRVLTMKIVNGVPIIN